MKFSTRQDIEAPAEYVFDRLSDFDVLERQAMRRGLSVQRKSAKDVSGVGATWVLQVPFRGKMRDLEAQVVEFERPSHLNVDAKSGGLEMFITLELLPLSPKRTRLIVGYDVKPQTLSARILVQSIKFAKTTLQKRFTKRVAKFCDYLETQYEAQA